MDRFDRRRTNPRRACKLRSSHREFPLDVDDIDSFHRASPPLFSVIGPAFNASRACSLFDSPRTWPAGAILVNILEFYRPEPQDHTTVHRGLSRRFHSRDENLSLSIVLFDVPRSFDVWKLHGTSSWGAGSRLDGKLAAFFPLTKFGQIAGNFVKVIACSSEGKFAERQLWCRGIYLILFR